MNLCVFQGVEIAESKLWLRVDNQKDVTHFLGHFEILRPRQSLPTRDILDFTQKQPPLEFMYISTYTYPVQWNRFWLLPKSSGGAREVVGEFPLTFFLPPPLQNNYKLKLDQVWLFQPKKCQNSKILLASRTFFH